MAEFFDVGHSRRKAWPSRPEAARLLEVLADPDRGFDAIVIGEYERAFYGNQFSLMAPVFEHFGVQLWMPEAGGVVDPAVLPFEELFVYLGMMSKREIIRSRARTMGSMTAQVREQGRFMGGRAPHGMRFIYPRPHPNQGLARRGVRLRALDVDPVTGPVVAWIFAMRLEGHSMSGITRALNIVGMPCPSANDPERNRHRAGDRWSVSAVRAILANPVYTGHAVWNRQRTDQVLIDPDNPGLGHRQVVRWNDPEQWVISDRPAHPALVDEAEFIAV